MSMYRQPFWGADQGSVLSPTTTVCTILAFTLANNTTSTSTIVAEYPITNLVDLTIQRPFMDDLTDTEYLIAVRYTDGETVYRYVLYAPSDFAILYPSYQGEKLGPSAVIEVWANPADALITASQDIVFNLNAITLYQQNNSSLCFCSTLTDTGITLIQTVITPQATGPCNPFCDCLELAAG